MSELTDELRCIATYGKSHKPTNIPTHCGTCGMRMPCDWSDTGETCERAADRIKELEAEIVALKKQRAKRNAAVNRWRRGLGPADIGMVRVDMARPATGEITQLWREATDDES